MDPNGVLPLIFRKGLDGVGWLRTFVESIRIDSVFPSAMRTDLLREASNDQLPWRVNDARPSPPRLPGCGFWSTIFPLLSATAWSVQKPASWGATAEHCGSFVLVNEPK